HGGDVYGLAVARQTHRCRFLPVRQPCPHVRVEFVKLADNLGCCFIGHVMFPEEPWLRKAPTNWMLPAAAPHPASAVPSNRLSPVSERQERLRPADWPRMTSRRFDPHYPAPPEKVRLSRVRVRPRPAPRPPGMTRLAPPYRDRGWRP